MLLASAVVRAHTVDFTNALTDAKKAVEIAPARSPFTWLVYVLRAQIYHELHEYEAAAADLETAGTLEKSAATSLRAGIGLLVGPLTIGALAEVPVCLVWGLLVAPRAGLVVAVAARAVGERHTLEPLEM